MQNQEQKTSPIQKIDNWLEENHSKIFDNTDAYNFAGVLEKSDLTNVFNQQNINDEMLKGVLIPSYLRFQFLYGMENLRKSEPAYIREWQTVNIIFAMQDLFDKDNSYIPRKEVLDILNDRAPERDIPSFFDSSKNENANANKFHLLSSYLVNVFGQVGPLLNEYGNKETEAYKEIPFKNSITTYLKEFANPTLGDNAKFSNLISKVNELSKMPEIRFQIAHYKIERLLNYSNLLDTEVHSQLYNLIAKCADIFENPNRNYDYLANVLEAVIKPFEAVLAEKPAGKKVDVKVVIPPYEKQTLFDWKTLMGGAFGLAGIALGVILLPLLIPPLGMVIGIVIAVIFGGGLSGIGFGKASSHMFEIFAKNEDSLLLKEAAENFAKEANKPPLLQRQPIVAAKDNASSTSTRPRSASTPSPLFSKRESKQNEDEQKQPSRRPSLSDFSNKKAFGTSANFSWFMLKLLSFKKLFR